MSLCTLALGACVAPQVPSSALDADIALTHVNVIDVQTGSVLPDQTILIDGNEIAAIFPSSEHRAAKRTVDYRGRYAIPGLWDMHTHTSSDEISRKIILPLTISYGVTGIREMNGDCKAPCWTYSTPIETKRKWQADIAAKALVGPRMVISSHHINQPKAGDPATPWQPLTAEDGARTADFIKARGADFAKVYGDMTPDALEGLAKRARAIGLPIAGHTPLGVSARRMAELGAGSLEQALVSHLLQACSPREDELLKMLTEDARAERKMTRAFKLALQDKDDAQCATLFETMKANGTYWTPTLSLDLDNASNDPAAVWSAKPSWRFLPKPEREYWLEDVSEGKAIFPPDEMPPIIDAAIALVGESHRAGVAILAGSDAGAAGAMWGEALHDELEALVAAGLSPLDVLRSATLIPARFFHREEELGTLAAGKLADIVILRSNPLDSIANSRSIEAVVANGIFYSASDLATLRENIERHASSFDERDPVSPSSGE